MLKDQRIRSEHSAKLRKELDKRREGYTQMLKGKIEQARLEEKRKQDQIELEKLNREREEKRLKEIEDLKRIEEERIKIHQEQLLNQQRLAEQQRQLDLLRVQLQNAQDRDDDCVIL